MSGDPSPRLINAVRHGDIETTKNLLDSCDLSHEEVWSDGYILLCEALQNWREEIAKLLLIHGAKVNGKSEFPSETPLHLASTHGYVEVVDMLLDRNADVYAEDQSKRMPIHCAVEKGSYEIVKSLLKGMVSLEVKSSTGMTPLQLAAHLGRTQIVEALLDHGANINSNSTSLWQRGDTPLHFATVRGDEATVALLLLRGADVNAINEDGSTPLHVSAKMNRYEVAKLLLKDGAKVDTRDKNGRTVLCVAVENDFSQMTKLILEQCPDLESKANRRCLDTAIKSSSGSTRSTIVDALLRYGFHINDEAAKDSKLLHAAVRQGCIEVVEDLLKLGVNVNSEQGHRKGMTILHVAAENHQIEVARLLIKHNANINAKDENRKTPIHYAVENRDTRITELLLDKGAYVKGTSSVFHPADQSFREEIVEMILQNEPSLIDNVYAKLGMTALHSTLIAKQKGASEFVKQKIVENLLDKGACVDATTENGETALHAAVSRGYTSIVELLLERGATVNVFDKKKITPLHLCASEGFDEIMEILLDRGADVNVTTESGGTALHAAVLRGDQNKVEKLLVEGKALISCQRRIFGVECVPLETRASNSNYDKTLKILLERGAMINAKLPGGDTPLHLAIKSNYTEAVQLLIEHGADVNDFNKIEEPTLHAAALYSNKEIFEILLNHSDNVDGTDKYGRTALHVAANGRKPIIVSLLLDHGSDVNLTSGDGRTPLDYATYSSTRGMILSRAYDHVVFKILKHHIVALTALNRYVSKKNLVAVGNNNSYYRKCKEEIECMKKTNIGDSNVSFYDILTKPMNTLAHYARNMNVVDTLGTGNHREKFTRYSGMVDTRFKNGQKRESLLHASLISFRSLIRYNFPDPLITELFNYVSNTDLENLIKAGRNSDP